MKKPVISVLLPVYKTDKKYLRECLESILTQTFIDFEFLIVDDCPEDKTVERIIKEYDDPRIKYYRNSQNLGISGSRNRLLNLAQGKYLAVMDHDDISLPARFEEQVHFLETHPEAGVVGCWYERFPNHKLKKKPVDDEEIKLALFDSCPILHPSSMLRKSVLDEHHIRYEQDFSPAEDLALWCRLSSVTQFANLPKVLFYYRDYGGNTSQKCYDKLMNEGARARERLKEENPELWMRAQAVKKRRHQVFSKQLFHVPGGYERDYCLFALPVVREIYTPDLQRKSFCGLPFYEKKRSEDTIRYKMLGITVKKTSESAEIQKAAALYRSLVSKPLIIFFDHALGGGTETYFRNQARELGTLHHIIRIQYLPKKREFKASFYTGETEPFFVLMKDISSFKKYIIDFRPQEIVVNNLVGYADAEAVLNLITDIKSKLPAVKVSARGHDFNPICPSFNLLTVKNEFCNIPAEEQCRKCFRTLRLADNPVQHRNLMSGAKDIASWRKSWQNFYENVADEMIVFGEAIKEIFEKAYPCLAEKTIVIPHKVSPLRKVNPPKHKEINICILGNIKLISKGRLIVREMAKLAEGKNVNIIVLGGFDKNAENIINIGKYKRDKLPQMIEELKADLVFIPSVWPETFSYTTAEAMLMELPVACFDIGTPAERVRKYDKGLIISKVDAGTALNEIINYVNRMRNEA